MRHRIHVPSIEPKTRVEGDEFHHSVRVVRLREGEEVELFDRSGASVRGVVETLARDHAVIVAGAPLQSRESPLDLHLAMAVIQLEKFELVLQKATELGVRSIIPLVADRGEVRPERYSGKMERWEKIVFEAVKQSGRTRVPAIAAPARFADVAALEGLKIVFDADESPRELPKVTKATLMIGPEGGWSEEELHAARERECFFQRLGPRRLRAETAAIAAMTVISSRFGDL